MNGRNRRLRGIAHAAAGCLALAGSAFLAPAQAGILRDVMASVGLAKPSPPAPSAKGANGVVTLPRQGFSCCVFRYNGDWINDGNYAELPMIPAGTPVEVLSYGRHRAFVKVDGKPMRLGHDYGRNEESLEAWVGKMVVDADPKTRIVTYAPTVQSAIGEGKVMVGMTREQVIAAIGYPLTSENPSLDAPTWKMWRSSRGEYDVNFGADGRVKSVTGDDYVTNLVVYKPGG